MPEFLTLPLEIKRMVYRYCLVVGHVFPYAFAERSSDTQHGHKELVGWRSTSSTKPAVNILAVCQTIRREAEPILYQNNTFNLPTRDLTARFFGSSLNTPERRSWLKRVEVSLEERDMVKADREVVLDEQLLLAREELLFSRGQDNRLGYLLHDGYSNHLVSVIWPRKLAPILNLLRLEKLVVDFSRACCPSMCCKLHRKAAMAFDGGFAMGMPTTMVIVGSGNKFVRRVHAHIELRTLERAFFKREGLGDDHTPWMVFAEQRERLKEIAYLKDDSSYVNGALFEV